MQFERGNAIARKNSRTEAAVKARNRIKELFLSRYDDNKDEALLLYLKAIGATNALLKKRKNRRHRLKSTNTDEIVNEIEEGINAPVRGRGARGCRGTRSTGARGRGRVSARRDCMYCKKSFTRAYYKTHLPKCPSKTKASQHQANFYSSSEGEGNDDDDVEIDLPTILNEVRGTNANTTIFENGEDEEESVFIFI